MHTHMHTYTRTHTHTQALIGNGHYASGEIQGRLHALAEAHTRLLETWEKKLELFGQCLELQVFLRDAEQRDTWIGAQETFLLNEDLGVRIGGVRLGGKDWGSKAGGG